MSLSLRTFGQSLFTATGAVLAGPTGALVGSLAGGLVASVVPSLSGFTVDLAKVLTTQAIGTAAKGAAGRLSPRQRQMVNHDLQTAFRDAFGEALLDLGGARCFPEAWQSRPRDVPAGLVFPLTPQADKLWRDGEPLAEQVAALFRRLAAALAAQEILPLDPPREEPEAGALAYLDAETPLALNDLFLAHTLEPVLAGLGPLAAELPGLAEHLRRHLLDRTLVHLGELLKARPRAWNAFNRTMLEGLRSQVRHLEAGQAELAARLDALLADEKGAGREALADWSEGVADLLAATGRIEKRLDEDLGALLGRVVGQHGEVVARLDGLMQITVQIEAKVDRVLRILENGQYVIEGRSAVALDEPPAPGPPPFKGLRHFDEGDAELFFGRELLTARLAGELRRGRRLAVVVGASGSGKSSVVRAGLIPALKRGERLADGTLPPLGSADWPVHVMTPTAHPLHALAASLSRGEEVVGAAARLAEEMARDPQTLRWAVRRLLALPRAGGEAAAPAHLLLVVDQLEEAFTLCADEAERSAFVDNLMAACEPEGESAGEPLILILALRADFYAHCAQYAALRRALERHQAYIGPMAPDELRRAVEEPARRGGWEFERGLVELIVRDVGGEPGALPLLSHALLETWRHRRGRVMTLESYAEAGGVRGAIAKTAESVFAGLSLEEQGIARGIFMRLTELGEGTQDTRRRVELGELIPSPEQAEAVAGVLQRLADARLVITGDDRAPGGAQATAEVAHEALIREWPTLRRWLDEDRAGLRVHRRLTAAAQEWARLERDEGLLYRGARLAEAVEWAEGHPAALNTLERGFLAASQALADRQAAEEEARRQRELEAARQVAEAQRLRAEEQARSAARLRRRAVVLAAALAAAVAFLVTAGLLARYAFVQRGLADERREAAQSAESTAVAERLRADGQRDAALAAQATAVAEGSRADAQRDAAVAAEGTAQAERGRAERQAQISLSRQLAAQAQARLEQQPDSALLLAIEANRISDTVEARASLLSGLVHSPSLGRTLHGHTQGVMAVAYSGDGARLVSGAMDSTIRVWDVADPAAPRALGLPLTGSQAYGVWGVAVNADGTVVAACDGNHTLHVWNLATPRGAEPYGEGLRWACLSTLALRPDGQVLASATDAGIVLWSLADPGAPAQLGAPLTGHTARPNSMAFSPDGRLLVSGGADGTVWLWDVEAGQPLGQALTGHTAWVMAVAFGPDGRVVASGGGDQTVRLWDVSTPASAAPQGLPLTGHAGEVRSLAFSPDGGTLASGSADHSIVLWDVNTGQRRGRPLTGHGQAVNSLAFSPDGATLASGSADGKVHLWDVMSPWTAVQVGPALPAQVVESVALSPDGRILAAGGWSDDVVRLWDVSDRRAPAALGQPLAGHRGWVTSVAFSPDGQVLFSGSNDESVRAWDLSEPARADLLSEVRTGHSGGVEGVAVSPDGRTLATGGNDGAVRLWDVSDVREPRALGAALTGHTQVVSSVAFSPDGRMLASGSWDGTIGLWDVSDPMAVGGPSFLRGHTGYVESVAFGPDGTLLASGSWDGTVRLWDVSTPGLATPLGAPLTGHTDLIDSVAFRSDGAMVASGSYDGTVRLWDVTDRSAPAALGPPLAGHTGRVLSVAFGRDGTTLASGSLDNSVILWDVELASWRESACRIANRNLTQLEWEQAFGSVPYAKTCERLPADASAVWRLMARTADRVAADDRDGASEALSLAARFAGELDDANLALRVCLLGVVEALAEEALPACEHAVASGAEEMKAGLGVGLGLARGLLGERAEAAGDLKAFSAWARANGTEDAVTRALDQATAELEAGRDPFTPEWLAWLRGQWLPGLLGSGGGP